MRSNKKVVGFLPGARIFSLGVLGVAVLCLSACGPLAKQAHVLDKKESWAVIEGQGATRQEALSAAREEADRVFASCEIVDVDCREKLTKGEKEDRGLESPRDPTISSGNKGVDTFVDTMEIIDYLLDSDYGWICDVSVEKRP